jgi:hypothetical protein
MFKVIYIHNVMAVYAICMFQLQSYLPEFDEFLCLFWACNKKFIVASFCWYLSNMNPILQETTGKKLCFTDFIRNNQV